MINQFDIRDDSLDGVQTDASLYPHRTVKRTKRRTNVQSLSEVRAHYISMQEAEVHASGGTATVISRVTIVCCWFLLLF
jgi:hypothetical protein